MQWLIDIVKEWIQAQGYLTTSFVDRGDPATTDFSIGDFTKDGIWHVLNLSGIVPTDAKAVSLLLTVTNTTVAAFAYFRTAGNLNTRNLSQAITQVSGVGLGNDIVLPLDENLRVEYVFFPAGWLVINLTVKGWWF